jgi:class 3 adenylate cyclase
MVNVASRVEGETERNQVFITESTLSALEGKAEVKKLSPVQLKGKSTKVQIYEVISLKL